MRSNGGKSPLGYYETDCLLQFANDACNFIHCLWAYIVEGREGGGRIYNQGGMIDGILERNVKVEILSRVALYSRVCRITGIEVYFVG